MEDEKPGNDIDAKIRYGLSLLEKPDYYYSNAELMSKREIIGSIYPEKLVYDGNNYRTTQNDIFSFITNNKSAINKKGLPAIKPEVQLSSPNCTVLEPMDEFLNHIERLFKLKDSVRVDELELV